MKTYIVRKEHHAIAEFNAKHPFEAFCKYFHTMGFESLEHFESFVGKTEGRMYDNKFVTFNGYFVEEKNKIMIERELDKAKENYLAIGKRKLGKEILMNGTKIKITDKEFRDLL